MKNKIQSRPDLAEIIKDHKSTGKKIVFTNGCFDLLHVGHIRYQQECKNAGDILVIGINTDQSIRNLKGNSRPLVQLDDRAEVLAALECVDYVVPFAESTPKELIIALKPNVLIKGGDYAVDDIVGKNEVLSWNGQVYTIPLVEGKSTSNLIKTIISKCT